MRPFSWNAIFMPQWPPLEVVFRAAFVYVFLFAMFRVLGRRSWTRYSAFNVAVIFLITVALRTTLVGEDSSLTSGVLAFSTMIFLDWLLSYTSFRNEKFQRFVSGDVESLYHDGTVNRRTLRRFRISRSDLDAVLRLHGLLSLSDAQEIFIERDGRISILTKQSKGVSPGRPEKGSPPKEEPFKDDLPH